MISVGIVGLGRSGWDIHCSILGNMPDHYHLLAVCDGNPEFLEQAKAQFKCHVYLCYEEFLKKQPMDLVVIATPTKFHFDMAKLALMNGFNVVIEKPICPTYLSLLELYEIANARNKHIFPFYNFRFSSDYHVIENIISQGCLGQINFVSKKTNYFNRRDDWQADWKEGGGIFNAASIHSVDQCVNINMNDELELRDVISRRVHSKGSAPDYCKIIMENSSNCIYEIENSWMHPFAEYSWLVCGTTGALRIQNNQVALKYFEPSQVVKEVSAIRSYMAAEKINWLGKEFIIDNSYKTGITDEFYRHIYEFYFLGQKFKIDESSVFKTALLVDKIMQFLIQ